MGGSEKVSPKFKDWVRSCRCVRLLIIRHQGKGKKNWNSFNSHPFHLIEIPRRVVVVVVVVMGIVKPFSAAPFPLFPPFPLRTRICRDKINGCIFSSYNNNNSSKRGGDDDDDDDDDSGEQIEDADWVSSPSTASPYQILGVDPASSSSSCSPAQLKAAFRARVKEFHPDVCKNTLVDADVLIQHVIRAYEILSKRHHREDTEGACLDPFEEPECEAYDLFVNEILCIGKGCPYSCVQRAPNVFSFTTENGTARATYQGHADDYQVQLAVGQCPRRCIHYVTPSQRALLEDLLHSVLNNPYNMGEAALLESLVMKATFENSRYQKPKRRPKASTEHVDWC